MKKIKTLFFIYFVISLIFTSFTNLQADPKPNIPSLDEIQKKAVIGRDLGFHRKYDQTIEYFKKISEETPHSPLGTFAQMTVWQARMLENYDFRFEKEYLEVSNKNQEIVNKVLDDPNASAWDLFLAGSSAGLRSFYYMRRDSILKTLSEANIVQKALKRAQEKDPTLVDVDLGFGMYDYWRSVFTNRFKFLPVFKDRRAEGLTKIERAANEGKLVGPLAQVMLALCYNNEGKPDKAMALLEAVLKKYPENIVAKNSLGDIYINQGKYKEAHQLFEMVKKQDPQITVAKFFKGKIYGKENKIPEARKSYEEFLATNPAPAWRSYALTDLAFLDLQQKDEKSAYDKFKTAYRIYPDNSASLKELNKLRDKRW